VYTCGAGNLGQLGINSYDKRLRSQRISNMSQRVMGICAGPLSTFVIDEIGNLWAMGDNSFGQLGLGHKLNVAVPTRVLGCTNIVKVVCGYHTAAITRSGELYVWGTDNLLIPTKLTTKKIIDIDIGETFGIALDRQGKLWVWGSNTSGELGVGDCEPRTVPEIMEKLSAKEVKKISCGGKYAIALGSTCNMSKTEPIDFLFSFTEKAPIVQESISQENSQRVLVTALTRQRDYLEEALRREKEERKSLEEEVTKLREECTELKLHEDKVMNDYISCKKEMRERIRQLEEEKSLLEDTLKESELIITTLKKEFYNQHTSPKNSFKNHNEGKIKEYEKQLEQAHNESLNQLRTISLLKAENEKLKRNELVISPYNTLQKLKKELLNEDAEYKVLNRSQESLLDGNHNTKLKELAEAFNQAKKINDELGECSLILIDSLKNCTKNTKSQKSQFSFCNESLNNSITPQKNSIMKNIRTMANTLQKKKRPLEPSSKTCVTSQFFIEPIKKENRRKGRKVKRVIEKLRAFEQRLANSLLTTT